MKIANDDNTIFILLVFMKLWQSNPSWKILTKVIDRQLKINLEDNLRLQVQQKQQGPHK